MNCQEAKKLSEENATLLIKESRRTGEDDGPSGALNVGKMVGENRKWKAALQRLGINFREIAFSVPLRKLIAAKL